MSARGLKLTIVASFLPIGAATSAWAAPLPWGLEQALAPERLSTSLALFLFLTVLSLAPAFVVMVTSFTRLVVVFSFLRQALGTQQMPPNQVLIALSIFLTVFIMSPVWQDIQANAIQPYVDQKLTGEEAIQRGLQPLKVFMGNQTRQKDLALFLSISKAQRPKNVGDTPISALVPAFMISELRTAFEIGFLLFLPFLIIDMVVASVLLSMGMMMLPPVMISLVFKVLLFVLVDGWNILVGSLVKSFH
ncbi:MAG: flagellar type III secretion system pore protein FliP [Desulfobaccales bacterium]